MVERKIFYEYPSCPRCNPPEVQEKHRLNGLYGPSIYQDSFIGIDLDGSGDFVIDFQARCEQNQPGVPGCGLKISLNLKIPREELIKIGLMHIGPGTLSLSQLPLMEIIDTNEG